MDWRLLLSVKYFFRRKSGPLSIISVIAVSGIAIGVATLIVTLGIMSGFHQTLKEKIVGINPHVLVLSSGEMTRYEQLARRVQGVEGITAVAPFVQSQAVLKVKGGLNGVLVKGIDLPRERTVTRIGTFLSDPQQQLSRDGIILGSELMHQLGVRQGDTVQVLSGTQGKFYPFHVEGSFTSGMYDYDMNIVLIDLARAQEVFGLSERVSGLGVRVSDALVSSPLPAQRIQRLLGYPFFVRTWMDMNRHLFGALKLEKIMIFVVLTLIILVASFNITSTILLTVMRKTKDIGVLRALGAGERDISAIFTLLGLMIGGLGTLAGTGAGIALALAVKKYQFLELPRDIYYISEIPVRLAPSDIGIIIAAAIGISLLAAVYPAFCAVRTRTTDMLRYE